MRARLSSGRSGASTAYQLEIGASPTLMLRCRFFCVSRPSQRARSTPSLPLSAVSGAGPGGDASRMPPSVPASRRTVALRRSSRIGASPSAGTVALQGAHCSSSVPVGSFQPNWIWPNRVGTVRPAIQGANHDDVARRMAVGTPTSIDTGPAFTRACHSSGPGARAILTTR